MTEGTAWYWAYADGKRRGKYPTQLDAMEALIMDPTPHMSIYEIWIDKQGRVLTEPILIFGDERRE
tara:strand:- start:4435 stop:4632 length:198 start_codon:yes stop_codon:yes gene_type:complete